MTENTQTAENTELSIEERVYNLEVALKSISESVTTLALRLRELKKDTPIPAVHVSKGKSSKKDEEEEQERNSDVLRVRPSSKPRLVDAMQQVMGNEVITPMEICARLEAKGWSPSSDKPVDTIRSYLSSNKDIFQKVEGQRGFYQLVSKSE